jgi:hypothetical protein
MSDIEFLDSLPTLVRAGSARKPDPEVVTFLNAVKANPGKWAKWPLPRKTKPILPEGFEGFEVASREGVFYVSYQGTEAAEQA